MKQLILRFCLRLERWLSGGRQQTNNTSKRQIDYDYYVRVNHRSPKKTRAESND